MKPPIFSIITPSYNQGQFIEDTIQSVLDQEGYFSIDYIIMDGGSKDNSVDIIKKYEHLLNNGKYPVKCKGIQYRWISEKDKGQSHAINKGFAMAHGDIGAWLNSDDYYEQGAFSTVVDFFQNNTTAAMVYGNGYILNSNTRQKLPYLAEPLFDLWKLIHLYDFILQPSAFMKLEALKNAGFLDEQLHYIMDWELWIRLSQFGNIIHIPEKLSYARVYFEAKTQAGGIKRWKEIRKCSLKYGHKALPPAMFTQFFLGPAQTLSKKELDKKISVMPDLIRLSRRVLYMLIGGNKSGVYIDGYTERMAFISIPMKNTLSKLTVTIIPLCANHVRYSINNKYSGTVIIQTESVSIDINLTDAMKALNFIHIQFVSENTINVEPTPEISVKRRCAFMIREISIQMKGGKNVNNIALPQYHPR